MFMPFPTLYESMSAGLHKHFACRHQQACSLRTAESRKSSAPLRSALYWVGGCTWSGCFCDIDSIVKRLK
jgi:hypothetical protein